MLKDKNWRSDDFDYFLPENLIAQSPAKVRQQSRLLVVADQLIDSNFFKLGDYLQENDLLILNDTRVLKARFFGHKLIKSKDSSQCFEQGGKVEVFIQKIIAPNQAIAMIRASKSPASQSFIRISEHIVLQIVARVEQFYQIALYETPPEINDFWQLCQAFGQLPLPPYIHRYSQQISDENDYQTVFAKEVGAVAAPTAGLHFDLSLLENIENKGIELAYVTLHVGAGTFMPLRGEYLSEHQMHSENYLVPAETIEKIIKCKKAGGRVIAVGTTSLRTLESAALLANKLSNNSEFATDNLIAIANQWQETNLFIYPGFKFQVIDSLITNFHLPKSSLLALVSAFAGYEKIKEVYQYAIEQQYRFFSYGDAMLLRLNQDEIFKDE